VVKIQKEIEMSQIIGIKQIKEILPFRNPFLMVDRAEVTDGKITAVKCVTMNENFFQGHFPGAPIMPGVLQVEAMLQTAAILLSTKSGGGPVIPLMQKLNKVKFRKPVLPSDLLVIEAEADEFVDGVCSITARILVNGDVASQAKMDVKCVATVDGVSTPTELLPALNIADLAEHSIVDLDVTAIQELIPHRYPFLLVDKLISFDIESKTITGLKNITINEPFFNGLPDEYAMLPNSLQMEIAAQIGCVYMLKLPENQGKIGYFMSIDKAVFYKPILPGDQMIVSISLAGSRGRFGKAEVKIYVGSELVTECQLKFAIGD